MFSGKSRSHTVYPVKGLPATGVDVVVGALDPETVVGGTEVPDLEVTGCVVTGVVCVGGAVVLGALSA